MWRPKRNRTIDYGFLVTKYIEELRINPSWAIKNFKLMWKELTSVHLVYINLTGQRGWHYTWLKEPKKNNLICCGTIVRNYEGVIQGLHVFWSWMMDDYPKIIVRGKKRLFRLYFCYAACKQGFLAGYRPIIGLMVAIWKDIKCF